MKITKEIQSNLNNIRYYTGKINDLARKQLNEDAGLDEVNVNVATKRFNALGCVGVDCEWLNIYCDNIEANLKTAESVDKELGIVEEEPSLDEGRTLF